MPNTMENYAHRLASFRTPHPATKKRASDPKGQRKLKWPHEQPSPEQMAYAGFYYNPTSSNPDNVTCYLCKSNLDGWEESDNPVDEHISHCQHCGWAINVWIEQAIERGVSDLEDPLSERMLEARKMTFSTGWPHEDKRGWLCKTQKMSDAGWHYAPTPESDDFVKCSYCSLSLDGWEPKDKPFEEHERRSPDCLFFKLAGPTKPKAAKRNKKERVSKASRLSTQSNLTVNSEALSFADVQTGGDDTVLSMAASTKAKTTKKGKGSGKTKKSTASKAASQKTAEESPLVANSYMEPEDDDFSVKVDVSPQPATKGRKRASHQISMDDGDRAADAIGGENPPAPKRRATRSRNSVLQPRETPNSVVIESEDIQMGEQDALSTDPAVVPSSKKGKKGGKKQGSTKQRKTSNMSTASKATLRVASPDDEELDAALELDLDRPLTDDEDIEPAQTKQTHGRRLTRTRAGSVSAKASVAPTRRTTRASTAPVDEISLHFEQTAQQAAAMDKKMDDSDVESQIQQAPKALPKKGRKTKQSKAKEAEEAIDQAEELSEAKSPANDPPALELKPTAPKRATRGRQPSRQKPPPSLPAPEVAVAIDDSVAIEMDSAVEQTIVDDSGHETDASVATQSRTARSKPATKKGRKAKVSRVPHQNLEDVLRTNPTKTSSQSPDEPEVQQVLQDQDEAIAAPHKQKPAKAVKAASKTKQVTKAAKAASPEQMVEDDVQSPTEAKEMTPIPSSQSSDAENHPPSSRPSATRPPLSSMSSPPRAARIPLADVTPIKSPSKHTFSKLQTEVPWTAVDLELIFQATPIEDKENPLSKFGTQFAANLLSSPEKKMSVEQWIQYRAQKGEQKLRTDCERLVGKFESQGMRALNTLEGIACTE